MTRYMRWLAAERGVELDGYDELWRWSVDELEDFWASIWDFFEVQATTPYTDVLGDASMPGAKWFTGSELNYAEHLFRDRDDDDVAILSASELRDLERAQLGRVPRPGRLGCGGPARAGGRPRRPRRRLPAEHPGDDRRVRRHREPRRDLVELLTGLRRLERRRPLRPDRAEGAVRRRRLPLRRARLRPPRHGGRAPAGDADAGAHRRPSLPRPRPRPRRALGRDHLVRARRLRRGSRAQLRAGPVRPPAVGPLLLGDDRPAEGDRPGPRRDPARAPEEAQPPPGRPGGRPRLLVHDDGLDDVELPRRRAARRARRSSPTTAAPATPTWTSSGTSPSARR